MYGRDVTRGALVVLCFSHRGQLLGHDDRKGACVWVLQPRWPNDPDFAIVPLECRCEESRESWAKNEEGDADVESNPLGEGAQFHMPNASWTGS